MKKTYFAPSVKVTEINTEEIICTSPSLTSTLADDGAVGLTRERGTRQKSETIFEEELW